MDRVCQLLGVAQPCTTATDAGARRRAGPLLAGPSPARGRGGSPAGRAGLRVRTGHPRACSKSAAKRNPTVTLDDLRRDVRLGMGPCQGGFCTYRAVGILHETGRARRASRSAQAARPPGTARTQPGTWPTCSRRDTSPHGQRIHGEDELRSPNRPNLLLRDFLQERWKGLTPILWGRQLKQERLDELIYLSLMNVDHLPDRRAEPAR